MLEFQFVNIKNRKKKNQEAVYHIVLSATFPLFMEVSLNPRVLSTFKFSYGEKGLQKNQFTNRATPSVWPFISDTPPLSPVLTVHDIPLICLMKI